MSEASGSSARRQQNAGAPVRAMRRSQRNFVVLVVVAVVAMLAGFLLGSLVRSPAQRIADVAPPEQSVITASVSAQQRTGSLIARGLVEIGQTLNVGPITSSEAKSVVTKVAVTPGATIELGSVVVEVSGRPVFLLQGDFPAYRDLKVGDSGPDAAAVNATLKALGLPHTDGATFTEQSSQGIRGLYERARYAPPSGGGMDLREVVFVSKPTAAVLSVMTRVGAPSDKEPLVTLASGESRIVAKVPASDAATISEGSAAEVDLGNGQTIKAVVAKVAVGATLEESTVTLQPEGALEAATNGQDVKVTIAQKGKEQSSLGVPVPAIFARADGGTVVVRVDAQGKHEIVEVQVGDIVGGIATVSAVQGQPALREGDQVVVSGPGLAGK